MSAQLYEAVVAFLEGDQGDLRTSVNADIPNQLAPGAVTVARAAKTRQQRRENAPPLTIEIVPIGPWPAREVGIGFEERDVVLELKTTLRRKDQSAGANQLSVVAAVGRALVARYQAVSNLKVVVQGAVFRRSMAELLSVDEVPESHELARSVVRVVFTFTQAQGDNSP
jgi:hypothetical protein